MPGGLLNIVAFGNQNVYLNGNPSKTFLTIGSFSCTSFGGLMSSEESKLGLVKWMKLSTKAFYCQIIGLENVRMYCCFRKSIYQ